MYPKSDHFHDVKNNKIKAITAVLVEVLASFLFISSTPT